MESQELVLFIDGSSPPPSKVIIKDSKSEINPEFADRLSCKSTYAAWHTMKKTFSSQSPLRIMLLKKELRFIQKKNMTMQSYLE
ncbi:hypothetical protein EJ110_NYTH48988 [Nymphaea thermarum]|nr:hypothetical protein EJ110_NYTH48988 [Nymphaea thermarum]